MNRTTSYEQLIAAKLDHVPVPDMSDSIWAGIETRLDTGVGAGTPKGKGWWYGFIGIAIVVALILVWWHYSHKSNAPERTVPKETVPMIKEPLPARDSSTIINKPKKKQPPVEPVTAKKDTLVNKNNSVDSTFRQDPPPAGQDISPVSPDSSSGRHNRVQPQHIDTVNLRPVVKKHRGVRGITDEDYKISTKKDSAGRKDR